MKHKYKHGTKVERICSECGERALITYRYEFKNILPPLCEKCSGKLRRGEKHWNWKGIKNKNGGSPNVCKCGCGQLTKRIGNIDSNPFGFYVLGHAMKNRKRSLESNIKISQGRMGKNNPFWKGGISKDGGYIASQKRKDTIKRRLKLEKALVLWADQNKIREIYTRAKILRKNGANVHVDHIIPLRGKHVSGLHTEHNLQIIPAIINLRKNNHYSWNIKGENKGDN